MDPLQLDVTAQPRDICALCGKAATLHPSWDCPQFLALVRELEGEEGLARLRANISSDDIGESRDLFMNQD